MLSFPGYWPSYNVPYFEKVYNLSGYPDFVKKHGLDFSYQLAPRAKIFRRDEGKVVDMDSMKKIMRYNGRFYQLCSLYWIKYDSDAFINGVFSIWIVKRRS